MNIYVGANLNKEIDAMYSYQYSSVNEAVEKAYSLRKQDPELDLKIFVGQGQYNLDRPILLNSQLNGLSIQAVKGEQVSISGAKPLPLKWKKEKQGRYVASVKGLPKFDQLIINGKLQTLARYPNYSEDAKYWNGTAEDAISPERIATWKHPEGAIFHAMHGGKWGGFHYRITGVDDNGEAILEGGKQNNRPSRPHKEIRFVENVFEELDAAGEWFVDQQKEKIYYMPAADLDLKNAACEGVVLKNLISIRGTEAKKAKDITVKGIKFQFTKRTIFEPYEQLLRSDWSIYRGGALFLSQAENCQISDCEFTDLGGNVIFISGYNRNHKITGNHIHDCGASAVSFVGESKAVRSPSFTYREFETLDEMDHTWGPKSEDYPSDCVVDDNLIYRIGRLEKQTAGVQIAMAMNITVRHNSIYQVPRAGINVGDGTWGGHVLEYNDVFDTVLETGDHGSFNSWGRDRFWHPNRGKMNELVKAQPLMPYWDAVNTTVIRNNRFRCDHGWDIDLDDGSSNYHIYNNLCLNGGLKLREGFRRVVENNVIINNSLHPHVWFEHSRDIFRRNIVQDSYKDVGMAGWGDEMDYNFFPFEESLMKSQVYGIDAHSAYGNPDFIDPSKMDYNVRQGSKALSIGFVNFDMDAFGVQKPSLKAIAKTPEVPQPKKLAGKANDSRAVEWLRATIKSVDSPEEQSAYGLNSDEGVIVLKIGAHSPLTKSGIKNRDVILEAEDTKVADLKNFFSLLKEHQGQQQIKVKIMRNQQVENHTISLR
ncbi:PDZ domain-containing protein [Persicobacter psychrovividus]|uniref:PDZ domain-containing protein n=1 Tax=Persicobacter psychrovividus TaxID=387638 RepID=UPI0030CA3553